MVVNYLVTALRSIKKDKQHFFLNLTGFSVGLAAAILMALFAQNELSYDKQHPDYDRVYLGHSDFTAAGLQVTSTSNFSATDKLNNHSQIEAIFKLTDTQNKRLELKDLVQVDGNYHRLNDFYAATSNILDFMALDIIYGDITYALTQPGQLALSETEALRLFGELQVVGNTIDHAEGQYTIGAVFKDLPRNTHFSLNSLIHLPSEFEQEGYGYVYFKLRANADISALEQQLTNEHQIDQPWRGKRGVTNSLMNMQKLHLHSDSPFAMKKGGSSTVLQICIGLSVILILIASINFINLNIAQSVKRAKEVGVRKALGATKVQVIVQFLTESLLVVTLAGLLAFTIVELTLPEFNQLMDRQLSLSYSSEFMLATIFVIFVAGLLSGLYPALFIASFSAKRVLSGDLARGGTAIFVRKLTLCFQGVLSVGLIIAAGSLYQQMSLINQLEVGYEKPSRLVIKNLPSEALFTPGDNSLLREIKNLNGVDQVTITNTDLTHDMQGNLALTWPNGERLEGMQPTVATGYYAVDTLGLNLLAGRDFSPEFGGDWYEVDAEGNGTLGVLVTRRMVELAGYQDLESVVGMTLIKTSAQMSAKIVGVIDDVKIGSARQQALPVSFNLGYSLHNTGHIVVKTTNADMTEISKKIQEIISDKLHLSDVQITQLSEDYANVHKNENQALKMVTIFSLLAIFLTCLGTFGLSSFATMRRQKEVAMRKVLGASRISIVNLLAKEFLLLMAVSILIALPLSYWLVSDWLENFNERITQSVWVYFSSAVIVTVITWLTVASLGFKAASSRPSLILRYE